MLSLLAKLVSSAGSSFVLRIASYAWPEVVERYGDYEANWLNIVALARHEGRDYLLFGDWRTTWELQYLTLWLHAVSLGIHRVVSAGGVEMYPDFQVKTGKDGDAFLAVTTAEKHDSGDYESVTIRFGCDPPMLYTFATDLAAELERFPVRYVASDGASTSKQIAMLDEHREALAVGREAAARRFARWPFEP
jgi:hypothetical protein